MSRSAGQPRDERTDTRGGVWTVVSWTWPARARVLLAFVVLVSGVALRVASDSLGTGRQRTCRVVPVLVIDPNTAPSSVLEALPHVGPSLVKQLIEQREIRPFGSTEDLRRRVRGFGPVTLARLTPHLRIAARKSEASADSDVLKSLSAPRRARLAQGSRPPVRSR
jgi:Helix-hairpin-helix motif